MKALGEMNPHLGATLALLIGCIGLLQYHSIGFWMTQVDPTTGAAWSLLLEGAALWLWMEPQWTRRLLGAAATFLLLAGPLYQVTDPVVREWRGADGALARRGELAAEIASLEGALQTFLANSSIAETSVPRGSRKERAAWAKRIDATQARLDAARAELAGLTRSSSGAGTRAGWQRRAIVAMQALALLLLQTTGVLCIGEIRRGRAPRAGREAPLAQAPAAQAGPMATVTPIRAWGLNS